MIRKTLTTPALAALLLMGGLSFTQTSCSSNTDTTKEVSNESDQAYNDFKTFVSDTEAKADAVATEAEADYTNETNQLKADFDAKVAAVDRYADQYDDARRQEIEQLRTRYTTAYDKREMAWKNRPTTVAGTTTGGGTGTSGMKPGKYYTPTSPAASITASNARATYESFVNNIKQNEDRYDIDDWRYINAEWRALDEAYDKVKGDIPAKDLAEIQKEKLKYAAFKSYDKTEARVAQGADAVGSGAQEAKAETADERSAVGRAASNTASDVKEVGKDVGQGAAKVGKKVGGAVKGAYKEVKSEVKNTDND